MLAALLQASKLKECYLQRYCKRQNLRNVTCIAYANAKTKKIGYCPKKCVTIIFHIFHFVQNYLLSFQHLH